MAKTRKITTLIKKHRNKIAVGAIGGLLGGLLFTIYNPTNPSVNVPSSINSTCSSDATSGLNTFFSTLSPNTNVIFPTNGCYSVTSTLLANASNIIIYGHSSRLYQKAYTGGVEPILRLVGDSGIQIQGLTIEGPDSGGGDNDEGDYGLYLEGNTTIFITKCTIEYVDGDFITMVSNSSSSPVAGQPNYNITISSNTLNSAGYHGITIEAVVGAIISDNTIEYADSGGIDLEYDTYPTDWVDGKPYGGVEDNVTVSHNIWNADGGVWIESLQGQEVQENNLSLIANTLTGMGFEIEIEGNATLPNTGLLITGNKVSMPYGGPSGASAGMFALLNVKNVNEQSNYGMLYNGYGLPPPGYQYNETFNYGNSWNNVTNGIIKNNIFSGGKGVITNTANNYAPWAPNTTPNTNVTHCGNLYGPNNPYNTTGIGTTTPTSTDGTC